MAKRDLCLEIKVSNTMHEKNYEIFWPNEKDLKVLVITLSGHKIYGNFFHCG